MSYEHPSGRAVRRADWSNRLRVRALVAGATDGERQAQCRAHRAGRHRLFAFWLLWLDHRNAEHRPAGRQRSSVRQLSHHRALFADARVSSDRSQSPLGRDARRVQYGYGVSEHAWVPAALGRNHGGRVAGSRLRNLCHRQVAPHTDVGVHCRGAVPQLAAAAGIRSLLRIHAGRDGSVLSGTHEGQPPHRSTGSAGRRLSRLRRRG